MLTELCLASDEFDHFAVQAHNSVTFCLKELRVRQRTKGGSDRIEGLGHGEKIGKFTREGEDKTVSHYINLADAFIQSDLQ